MMSDLPKHVFRSSNFYSGWYTQQFIVADTTFSVPRSSSYTHQFSDSHSNLVTTPFSSIDLTSQSGPHLSLPFLCRFFLIIDKLKNEMTNNSFHHAGKNGSIPMEKTGIMLLRMECTPVFRISMVKIATKVTSTSIPVLRLLMETA